jgi:dolichol-phosphate mannosyltransferase
MHHFVVLAYNEEQNIHQLFSRLLPVANGLPGGYRIIVVDDGSTDRTSSLVAGFAKTWPVQVERHEKNKGVAEGFRTGFRAALAQAGQGDTIFTMEADNSGEMSLIPLMAERVGGETGVVLASCYMRGGSVTGVPFLRRLMSRGINLFMRTAFPIEHCHTYSSFFRAYSFSALRLACDTYGEHFIESEGFTVAPEILFKLHRLGVAMDELPMQLRFGERSGKSKMKVVTTIIDYIRFLSREFRNDRLAVRKGA